MGQLKRLECGRFGCARLGSLTPRLPSEIMKHYHHDTGPIICIGVLSENRVCDKIQIPDTESGWMYISITLLAWIGNSIDLLAGNGFTHSRIVDILSQDACHFIVYASRHYVYLHSEQMRQDVSVSMSVVTVAKRNAPGIPW
jgi:hypothetical protein